MTLDTPTIVGWVGMVILVTAYALRERLSAARYSALNLVAACALAVTCYASEAWPVFALQIVWGSIAVRDLWRVRGRGRKRV